MIDMQVPALAMWMPGPLEWAVIGVVALLIFGRRLPDVARSVGKSIVEFKRGLRDVKDEVDTQSRIDSPPQPSKLSDTPKPNDPTPGASDPSKNSSSAAP